MKNKKGFTLVELLVVIVILGIITGLSIPLIRNLSASMEKKKYTTYSTSLVNASKLYNDSYSEDLFGHNENGCAYVTYEQLVERNLLKDIEISDVSCNSSSTFVRILKIGDKYSYSPFLGCGKKKDGKAGSIDTTLPVANQENVMKPEYCTGTEENNLEIVSVPVDSKAFDKKKKKAKIKITSGTGINPKIVLSYKWSTSNTNVSGDFTSVSFKVPGDQKAMLLKGDVITTKSSDITTPDNSTGNYYLIIKVDQLQDLYGSKWVNKNPISGVDSKYVAFGPFAIDNHKPDASFVIASTNPYYNSLNTTVKITANDQEVGKNVTYCISNDNDNCNPTTKYVENKEIPLKMNGAYDGKERTVYIAVKDVAGNVTRISKKYKVDKQYLVRLDGNGATTPGSLTTTVIYNDVKLGTISKPRKIVTITYVNNVGATVSGGQTSREYNLNGWYTAASGGSKVASNSTTPALEANVSGYTNANKQWKRTTESTTLYAHWDPVIATLPKVTKTGYTCKWTTDGGEVASGGVWKFTSANSRTFTAVCSPNTYKVNLNGNGQTVNGSTSTTATYDATTLKAITKPRKIVTITYVNNVGATVSGGQTSREYNLNGWYTAASGGSKVADGAATPSLQANVSGYTNASRKWINTSESTLYAHWDPVTATLPSISKTGYTCKWTTDNGSSSVSSGGTWSFSSANSRTFTASCTQNAYKVNLNGNGQTVNGSSSTTATYGATTLKAITKPRKIVTITYVNNVGATTSGGETSKEYTLNGWWTAASGGSRVANNAATPGLYANVSGYTNGSSQWTKTSESTLYAHWDAVTATLPSISKTGYTCKWTTSGGEVASGGTWTFTSANSRTFTASCSPAPYPITYNLNGGTVSSANKTSYNIETATFTLNNPTKTGYTFTGWSGTGLSGTGNKTVTISKGSTGNRSYTAHWSANTYKIKYNMNTSKGGSGSSSVSDTSCSYGSTCNLVSSVSNATGGNSSRSFVGWYTSANGGTKVTSVTMNTTSDKTVYAHWTGWQQLNNPSKVIDQQWVYWSNSSRVTGEADLRPNETVSKKYHYYFSSDGIAQVGWQHKDGVWYYYEHADLNGNGDLDARRLYGECRYTLDNKYVDSTTTSTASTCRCFESSGAVKAKTGTESCGS